MWGTSQGDRTLSGDEARLIRQSVGHLRDMITAGIDLNEPYRSSVEVFNRLQPTQQLAVLHEVAYGLLDPTTPILELTAVREATVYAIYRELISLIEIEIELTCDLDSNFPNGQTGDSPGLRESKRSNHLDFGIRCAVVDTCQACCQQANEWGKPVTELGTRKQSPGVSSESTRIEEWSRAVEFLADQVLWDRDFDMEEIFADHDPAKIADIKRYFGIHEDYFSTPAPDAYSAEYARIDRELVLLAQSDIEP